MRFQNIEYVVGKLRLNRAEAANAGRARAPRGTRPKEFWQRRASARNPSGGPACGWIRQAKNLLQRSTEPSAAIGIQPCDRKRQLEPRKTCDHRFHPARVSRQHRLECAKQPRFARSSRNLPQPPSSHRSSPPLFVKPRIDLRHQDRPKRKFPDLRFPGQPAQVAAS